MKERKNNDIIFKIEEDPALEGTFKIKIQSQKPLGLFTQYAKLISEQTQCVALVDSVDEGSENLILTDRFLKLKLGYCKDNCVKLESFDGSVAEYVKLYIPSDLLEKNIESRKWMFTSNRHNIQTLLGMAKIYGELGDRSSAERNVEKVEKMIYPETESYDSYLPGFIKFLSKPVNHMYWKAQVDLIKAKHAIKENDYQEATKLLINIENIGRILGSYNLIVDTKNLLGDIYFVQNKYDNALKSYSSGLNIAERFMDRYTRAIFLIKKAKTLNILGETEKAKEELSLAMEIAKTIGSKEILWQCYYHQGIIFEDKGDYSKAVSSYKEAINIIESIRGKLKIERERTGFIGERISPYDNLVAILIKMHKIKPDSNYDREALHYAERAKARTFIEALTAKEFLAVGYEDKNVIEKEKELLHKIAMLKQKLFEKGGERTKEELEQAELDYYNFIEEIKRKSPELASIIAIPGFNLEKIQGSLDSNTSILEYYITNEITYLWLIERDKIKIYDIPKGKDYMKKLVNTLISPMLSISSRRPEPIMLNIPDSYKIKPTPSDRENFLELCNNAYNEIFSVCYKYINTSNLIIVPHGVLHKLPFSLLYDGKEYLVDKYNISVLPSLAVLEFVWKKKNPDNRSFLAFANPTGDLPNAENEVSRISQNFNFKEVYYKNKATEDIIKDRASGFDVIHFACHGEFNERQPLFSGLLLAKSEKNDGYLRVHEVFGLDLKNSNLVVLSACETAIAKIEGGDDLVGLSRGFMYAGAPSVLGTLWAVEDPATTSLMEMFYEN